MLAFLALVNLTMGIFFLPMVQKKLTSRQKDTVYRVIGSAILATIIFTIFVLLF